MLVSRVCFEEADISLCTHTHTHTAVQRIGSQLLPRYASPTESKAESWDRFSLFCVTVTNFVQLKYYFVSQFGECPSVYWRRAIAQAISCRLLTAQARVCAQISPCEFCATRSGTGAGFSPPITLVFLYQYLLTSIPYSVMYQLWHLIMGPLATQFHTGIVWVHRNSKTRVYKLDGWGSISGCNMIFF